MKWKYNHLKNECIIYILYSIWFYISRIFYFDSYFWSVISFYSRQICFSKNDRYAWFCFYLWKADSPLNANELSLQVVMTTQMVALWRIPCNDCFTRTLTADLETTILVLRNKSSQLIQYHKSMLSLNGNGILSGKHPTSQDKNKT